MGAVCDCSHDACRTPHLNQLIKPVNKRSRLHKVVSATADRTARHVATPRRAGMDGNVTSVRAHVDAWLAHLHRNCPATQDELPRSVVPGLHRYIIYRLTANQQPPGHGNCYGSKHWNDNRAEILTLITLTVAHVVLLFILSHRCPRAHNSSEMNSLYLRLP